MEYCYVCGGRGYCQPVYVINPPNNHGNEPVPFFPFLEHQNRPSNASPISPEGTVKVCTVCYSYLIRQWYDNEQRGVSPLRRMYFMKRLDGAVYSGAHPNAPHDVLATVSGQSSSNMAVLSSPSSVMDRTRASPSRQSQLPSEHHIKCFICHNPCLKWDAKTVYSAQVLENKEFFPFLNGLKPPDKGIPLTNEATKICASCESELVRQWDHFNTRCVPHEYRDYRVLTGTPSHMQSFSNANYMLSSSASLYNNKQTTSSKSSIFIGKKCALCNNLALYTADSPPRFISWSPRNGGMHFPFLSGMTFPANVVFDSEKGEVLVCHNCYTDLSQQWAAYEHSRYPHHMRRYKTRHTHHKASPTAPVTEESQPVIAQCHVCLLSLRDPHALKTLRSKLEGGAHKPFFPILSKIRSTPQLKSNFPVCDHCYYNLMNQWRVQEQAGVQPQCRQYTHQEYLCCCCSCLRAEKMDVAIIQEKIYCLDCVRKQRVTDSSSSSSGSTVPPLKPVPAIAGNQSRSSANSLTTASSSVDKSRTTVVVPPMLQQQPSHSAANSGYAEALRQLAKQVSSTTADVVSNTAAANSSLVESLSASNGPSLPGSGGLSAFRSSTESQKKQPVAAVAPSQRLNSTNESSTNSMTHLPTSSAANNAMTAASVWLHNASSAGGGGAGLEQQLAAASLEWEQQMAMYSSVMRASLLQSPYYAGMNPNAPRLPGLYPNMSFSPHPSATATQPNPFYPFHPPASITPSLPPTSSAHNSATPHDMYMAAMNTAMMANGAQDANNLMMQQYQQKLMQEFYKRPLSDVRQPASSTTAMPPGWPASACSVNGMLGAGSTDPQLLMLQYMMQLQAANQNSGVTSQSAVTAGQMSPQKHGGAHPPATSLSTPHRSQSATPTSALSSSKPSTLSSSSAAGSRGGVDKLSASSSNHHSKSSTSHRSSRPTGPNSVSNQSKDMSSTPKSSRQNSSSSQSSQKTEPSSSSTFSISQLIPHSVDTSSPDPLSVKPPRQSATTESHNERDPVSKINRPKIDKSHDVILDLSRSSSSQPPPPSSTIPKAKLSAHQPAAPSPAKQPKLYRPFELDIPTPSRNVANKLPKPYPDGGSLSIEEHFRRSLSRGEVKHSPSSPHSKFTKSVPTNHQIHPLESSTSFIRSKINLLGRMQDPTQMEKLIKKILIREASKIPNTRSKSAYLEGVRLVRRKRSVRQHQQSTVCVSPVPLDNQSSCKSRDQHKIWLLRRIRRVLTVLKLQTCPRSESKQVHFLPSVGKRENDSLLNIYKILKTQRYREKRAQCSPRK